MCSAGSNWLPRSSRQRRSTSPGKFGNVSLRSSSCRAMASPHASRFSQLPSVLAVLDLVRTRLRRLLHHSRVGVCRAHVAWREILRGGTASAFALDSPATANPLVSPMPAKTLPQSAAKMKESGSRVAPALARAFGAGGGGVAGRPALADQWKTQVLRQDTSSPSGWRRWW